MAVGEDQGAWGAHGFKPCKGMKKSVNETGGRLDSRGPEEVALSLGVHGLSKQWAQAKRAEAFAGWCMDQKQRL